MVERLAALDAEHSALQAEAQLLRECPAAGGLPVAPADPAAAAARRLPVDAGTTSVQVLSTCMIMLKLPTSECSTGGTPQSSSVKQMSLCVLWFQHGSWEVTCRVSSSSQAAAELLAAQLQAAAAEGRAERLHARLLAWFGAAAAATDPDGGIGLFTVMSSKDGAVLRPATPNSRDVGGRSGSGSAALSAKRPAFGAGGTMSQGAGGKASTAHQARLETTVGRLDAALAKAQREAAGAVSTVKYMQVVL